MEDISFAVQQNGNSASEQLPDPDDVIRCGPIWVSPSDMCEVRIGRSPVALSAGQIRIVARLLEARGRVVSRAELYEAFSGRKLDPTSRAVDIHIARIRRALGELGRFLVTVRGRGYRISVAALSKIGGFG